jgi:cell division septation protein DedD
MKGDEGMADKKDNKPAEDDSPFNSSGELFETLFREELDTLTNGQQEKAAPKTDRQASAAKTPKSPAKVKGARPRKAVRQTAAKAKNDIREKPAARVHVDRPKHVSAKAAANTGEVAERNPVSVGKVDAPEEVKPKKREKFGKIRRGRIGSQPKIGGGSDKIKIAVLSVILVAALAFIINALGIVNFAGLLGFSEPTKKERIKPRVSKKPPAKTDQKTTRVAIKPPPKRTTPQAADKPTIQKRTLVVKKAPQAAPSKEQPQTATKRTKPTTTAKKPVVVQQRYRPATPPQKPPVVQQPPKPPPPDPRPVVVMKPPPPTPSTQEPVANKKPYRPAPSQPSPVVAKKPPAVATPKPLPVLRQPVKPSAQGGKKPALGKEELFPEENALPYPYSVYLGAYKTPERAEKAISIYRNKGLSAYWVKVDLGDKGVWYRVFTGYFKDQNEAEAFIRRKRIADATAKRTKYATLIGIYATERDAQKEFLALSKLGYSPYVVETAGGESQLYVGAFYTKAGAEQQRLDLASKGVQSRVVER